MSHGWMEEDEARLEEEIGRILAQMDEFSEAEKGYLSEANLQAGRRRCQRCGWS